MNSTLKFQESEKQLTVAVCAREDSLQLRRLISALFLQGPPETWKTPNLVVVVNGSEKANPDIRDFLVRATPPGRELSVVFETRKGIPFARNAALDFVRGIGCEWIAFIDDDCDPDDEWLYQLCLACDETGSDGAAGSWTITPVEKPSRWIPDGYWGPKDYLVRGKKATDLSNLETAYTRSVIFNLAKAIDLSGEVMRFDTRHASRGGSDVKFFHEYIRAGRKLVFARRSLVDEKYKGERLRLRWHVKQKIRNTQLILEREVLNYSPSSVWRITYFFHGLLKAIRMVVIPSRVSGATTGHRQNLGNLLLHMAPLFALLVEALGFRYHAYSDTWKFLR